jgi:hypothetical protein
VGRPFGSAEKLILFVPVLVLFVLVMVVSAPLSSPSAVAAGRHRGRECEVLLLVTAAAGKDVVSSSAVEGR